LLKGGVVKLHVGIGVGRGALTIFPVWGEYDGPRGYSSNQAPVVLRERDGQAQVPVLVASNGGERPVLMLEGQLLEGGWQNRVLVRSHLVPARTELELEVACVEAGRWGGAQRHAVRDRRSSVRIRSALSWNEQDGRQGEVWRRVSEYDARYGVNPTSSFTGHLDRAADDVARLIRDLRPLPGQSGVVIGIAGQPVIAEVFDSPITLRRHFTSIIAAAGMDALGADPITTPSRRARRFIDRANALRLDGVTGAGMGTTVRGRDQYADVSGLSWRNRLVHATLTNVRHPLYASAAVR